MRRPSPWRTPGQAHALRRSAGHPGFNIPVDEQARLRDYVIRFEKEETQRCPGIVGDKLLDYSQITLELEASGKSPCATNSLPGTP